MRPLARLFPARSTGGTRLAAIGLLPRQGKGGKVLPLAHRFWPKVKVAAGCWLWMGGRNPQGYGQVALFGRVHGAAHRVGWLLSNGPIPEGLAVLHRCDNPPCVNPDHLFLGTLGANAQDREIKKRGINSRKTHCPQGHAYSDDNIYRTRGGKGRVCRTCCSRLKREGYRRKVTSATNNSLFGAPRETTFPFVKDVDSRGRDGRVEVLSEPTP